MEEVGGRGGASGARGRLRLRALQGLASLIQHALLPLDEVRRIEKVTAFAADLRDPRNGCLDACLCARLVADLAGIWVALWRPLATCGVTWDDTCKPVLAFGLDWVRQSTQMSYLAVLCRREH